MRPTNESITVRIGAAARRRLRRGGATLAFCALVLALVGTAAAPAAAQDQGIQPAFGDSILRTLGYHEVAITVSPEGVEAPATLEAGYHLVTLSASEGYAAYVDFMQPPAGLSKDEATELALAAAVNDLAQEGWVYAGGNNTFGEPVSFIVDLAPGEYRIAASYYTLGAEDEVMRLLPLTVTEPGTPAADAAGEPPASVTLEETDELRYHVSPDPVPAGANVWKIANTGERHPHHVVMSRVPDGVTADAIVDEFTSLFAGTPPAGEPLAAQFVWVGYAALQSGGQTTWIELDLTPGTYAVVCFIVDPHTDRPHVLDGMATVFIVA